MVFGSKMRLPIDITFGHWVRNSENEPEYVYNLKKRILTMANIARKNYKMTHDRQKRYYDKNTYKPEFEVNDIVYLFNNARKKKLDLNKWHGPYKITQVIDQKNVRLQRLRNAPKLFRNIVSIDRIKLFKKSSK